MTKKGKTGKDGYGNEIGELPTSLADAPSLKPSIQDMFDKPTQQDMFDGWAKRSSWDCVNEGVPLSLGLDPDKHTPEMIQYSLGDRPQLLAKFRERSAVVSSHVEDGHVPDRLPPEQCLDLLKALDFPYPEWLTKAVESAPTVRHSKTPQKNTGPDEGAVVKPSDAIVILREESRAPKQLLFAEACEGVWNAWPPESMRLGQVHNECCNWLDKVKGKHQAPEANHITDKTVGTTLGRFSPNHPLAKKK